MATILKKSFGICGKWSMSGLPFASMMVLPCLSRNTRTREGSVSESVRHLGCQPAVVTPRRKISKRIFPLSDFRTRQSFRQPVIMREQPSAGFDANLNLL
jgi:hypothetical protein